MEAREAFTQADEGRIAANTPHGVVVLYRRRAPVEVPELFLLSFIPRDTHGHLNVGGTVRVGEYRELKEALTVAAEKYGTSEDAWDVASEDSLRGANIAYHYAPPIEQGHRFIHPNGMAEESEDES